MCHVRWKAALIAAVVGMLSPVAEAGLAQRMPVPDDTLGENSSTLRPIGSNYPGDVVEGGLRQGSALFHSFEEFNVEAGRAIYFSDPGVDSILSRVTGEAESQILGLLGVFGDADLFIINPNGIIFGENARLDLRGGSFLATTANSVEFNGGVEFESSGADLSTAPLLTVQPSAFLFNRANPAAIANNSRTLFPTGLDDPPGGGLRVADGERITLLGGNISLDNGGLSALGGRVEVGGLSEPGTVGFNIDGSLAFPAGVRRSDVSIANGSRLVASDSTISGGSVTVTADVLDITNNSGVSAGTVGGTSFVENRAGDITLDANTIRVVSSNVDNLVRGSRGRSGDVLITANELLISEGSNIQSVLLGEGSTGKVKIDGRDRIVIDNGLIFSNLGGGDRTTVATGNAGNIEITTPVLLLTNGTQLQSNTFGQGNAGDVVISASESVVLESSAIFSDVAINFTGEAATGGGGNVQIATPSLSLSNNSLLSSRTRGQGNGGSIEIAVGSLSVTEESLLLTDSSGQGNAGNVSIETRGRTVFDRSRIISNLSQISAGDGADTRSAGDIQIATGSLDLLNNSAFEAIAFASGDAGDITIRARDGISIENRSDLISGTRGQGNGGNIQIAADSLSVTKESQLLADSSGQGNAGNVSIETLDRTVFSQSRIASNLGQISDSDGAAGNIAKARRAGDIAISAGSLDLLNGAQLQSITSGQGNAGNVIVQARDRISIEGVDPDNLDIYSSILASTDDTAQGSGGDVSMNADSVRLAENGFIFTSTFNRFPGGTVAIDANTLDIASGAQIVTRTSGDGRAGDINLNIADRTTLSGTSAVEFDDDRPIFSGLFANTLRDSAGDGGTVRLATSELQVLDRARIEVDSRGSGTAGDIAIAADTVRLDNGRLTAETSAVNGGNIALEAVDLLLLRNGSLISTTAGTAGAGGNGGNIEIDSNILFSVPRENSDIRANAFSGSGGRVRINTSGIFGIAAQSQDNPLTSDITASSQQGIQGTVDIETPETDPRSGLTELPATFADASNQITQTCSGNRDGQNSEFIVSGRGGLPSSPIDALASNAPTTDWAILNETTETNALTTSPSSALLEPALFTEGEMVEAQGWTRENGSVKLVAAAPAVAQTTACRAN